METVVISYKPAGSAQPARRHLERTLPSGWHELTPAQVWHCMDHLMRGLPRRQLVEYLLQLPVYMQQLVQPAEMYDLLRCITWMEINPAATAPVAPYIDIEGYGRFHLPSDKFGNVTGLEYALIDELYQEYMTTKDVELEIRLAALILRPEGVSTDPTTDARVQLMSQEQTHAWIPAVRALPESIRVYIITLISGCRQYVYDTYGPWLFTRDPVLPGDDDGEVDTPADDGQHFGWWGSYMDVAGDHVLGDYYQVLHTAFHDICMYMVRKVIAARRQQVEQDHARLRSNM